MPRAVVDGADLYFEERGGGVPVLCFPGALGTGMTDFGPQLETWSTHFRVVAPDPRGYGRSRPPDRDFCSDFFLQDAEDMAHLMSALGYDTFVAAGWSDGANSAALLASVYPERVQKLVIWGGNSYISKDDIDRIENVRSLSNWSTRMRQTLGNVYGDDLQSIWSRYCDGLQAHYQAGGQICRDRLHIVCCPTLILHGALDPIVPDFHPQVFHQEIRGSRFHVFSQGRHNIHLALAPEFNTVVAEFLLE